MFKTIKEAFKITNYNIILTIPLILFVKIFDLYSVFTGYSIDSIPKIFITSFVVLLMFGIFCSAWLFLIKGAVEISKKIFVIDSDRTKETFNLFKSVFKGIHKYFLSFVGVYAVFAVIQIILSPVVYIAGIELIGNLDSVSLTNAQDLALQAANENNSMAVLIDSLTPEQIIFFAKWSLLFMLMTSVVMYLLMLWIPEILYNTLNPIKALFKSIGKLFGNFAETLSLFAFLWVIGLLILFCSTFSLINPFAYLIMNVVSFYFVLFMAICIFLYYNKRFCKDEE